MAVDPNDPRFNQVWWHYMPIENPLPGDAEWNDQYYASPGVPAWQDPKQRSFQEPWQEWQPSDFNQDGPVDLPLDGSDDRFPRNNPNWQDPNPWNEQGPRWDSTGAYMDDPIFPWIDPTIPPVRF